MSKLNKIILVFLISSFCAVTNLYAADKSCYSHPAMKEVIKTVDKIIAELEGKKSQIKKNSKLVYGIINRVLVPKADFEVMSRLVLTRNWKKLNYKQRKDFIKEFSRLMIRTYGVAFESYDGETVGYSCPYRKLPKSGASKRLEIATTVHSPNRPDSIVKFRILEKDKSCAKCSDAVNFCKRMVKKCKKFKSKYSDLKSDLSSESNSKKKEKLSKKIARSQRDYGYCKKDYNDCKQMVDECKTECEQCQKCEQGQGTNCSQCASEWVVYDLIIDNVSIINSYRMIFKDKFRKQSNPDKIIADMHKKNCKIKMFCV